MNKLWLIAAVGAAGAAGTLARLTLGNWVQRSSGSAFPWGVLTVNVLGCFAFGVAVAVFENRLMDSEWLRMIVLVGFMGAFTTFSTLAFHTGDFLRTGQWPLALANVAAHNLVGVVCILLGLFAGKMV